jgi:hypothetical protein
MFSFLIKRLLHLIPVRQGVSLLTKDYFLVVDTVVGNGGGGFDRPGGLEGP